MPTNFALPGWLKPSRAILSRIALIATLSGIICTFWVLRDSDFESRSAGLIHQAVEVIEHASADFTNHTLAQDSSDDYLKETTASYAVIDAYCNTFPDPGNISIVVKTGATELHDKVPTQLTTFLRCVSNPLIFSDLDQRLGDYEVHDVLSRFSPKVMEDNRDFDIYRQQQEYMESGRENDLPKLRDLPIPSDDWRTKGNSAAWGLDKYKFLHMVERSWELAPNKAWYLFLEADVYLSWPNLLRWLPTLDPQQKLYFGKPVRMFEYPGEFYFGYGGSGILISGAAAMEFAVTHRGIAKKWDKRISKMWFGDYVLAAALHEELHLDITDAWSSLPGYQPAELAFGPEIWCQPVVTLHHMTTQHLNGIWQYERKNNASMLLFRGAYLASFPGGLPGKRADWDNSSDDDDVALEVLPNKLSNNTRRDLLPSELVDPHAYYQACELACNRNEQCFQFSFITTISMPSESDYKSETKCHLSGAFRLGRERLPEVGEDGLGSGKTWASGWMRERIDKWVGEHRCEESSVEWPHQ